MRNAALQQSRDNYMRTVRFEHPDYIPMNFAMNMACLHAYPREAVWDLFEAHPFLFPDFVRPPKDEPVVYPLVARKDEPYTDPFGCVWTTGEDGLTGAVHGHPLEDWSAYASYRFPDPAVTDGLYAKDWAAEARHAAERRAHGYPMSYGLRHGHTFLQLQDLRGYENLLYDMMDGEPLLDDLIRNLTEFNKAVIRRYLALGAEIITIPEDLGMQTGPMLSPAMFEKYILPAYRALACTARESGALVHMHSDGDIRLLLDGILSCGVDMINLQDLVNGIDWIAAKCRGKTCVELDIDRQNVTVFGTPADVDRLILDEIRAIGTPAGGLMMVYGWYPGTPIENAAAVMDAMEHYAGYFR